MAQSRLLLHDVLKEVLGTDLVYFQPSENVEMQYPCIVYKRDLANTEFADNGPYRHHLRYLVTYIDRNPDNIVTDKIKNLPYCRFERFFTADNLNHDVFNLHF